MRYRIADLHACAQRPDTAADINARLRDREDGDRILREVEQSFGGINGNNAGAVLDFQQRRLAELRAERT